MASADTYTVKLCDENSGFAGQFVSISMSDATIIGVVTGVSHSIREDMVGYISQDKKIKYQPYIEDYKNSYCTVHGLGTLSDGDGDGAVYAIDRSPHIDDPVKPASHDEIVRFHTAGKRPHAPYLHDLRDRLQSPVILKMIDEIRDAVPESEKMLDLVRKYMKRIA
ncbi:MAG: hypothetical protein C4B59_07990 [Candidatus Methanogaster sp.]|uniref:Uncharacterized protein n=1 Tax=Candidatus Methanogaster sp. TaxID=3386292 RepID=A0AC61L2W3_9EURY|nr:MAG: hypothetical protein C4B59_07990 [ANME-2 cluster archaeon]